MKPFVPGKGRRLSRRDLALSANALAERLLGCIIERTLGDGRIVAGRIVETEAYLGVPDKACHSFGGRRTVRVEPMYGPAGTAYLYFTYGMHTCMNVVCGAPGEPVAVLLRALEPVAGVDAMRVHRSTRPSGKGKSVPQKMLPKDDDLCRGPASLCRALALGLDLTGGDLCTSDVIRLVDGTLTDDERASIRRTARVGVRSSAEWADLPLRWLVGASRCVSGPLG